MPLTRRRHDVALLALNRRWRGLTFLYGLNLQAAGFDRLMSISRGIHPPVRSGLTELPRKTAPGVTGGRLSSSIVWGMRNLVVDRQRHPIEHAVQVSKVRPAEVPRAAN